MRKLSRNDNLLAILLSRVMELVLLGLLCLLCCLPVVTVGPAVTALFGTISSLRFEAGNKLVKSYFQAFREHFKTALQAWMLGLMGFAALLCYWLLLRLYLQGVVYTVLTAVLILLALGLEGTLCYLFPLISRYGNSLQEHIRNAVILMIRYFPRTLLMVLIQLLPLLMFCYLPFVLLYTLLFWALLCPGLSALANVTLLRPVFAKLEETAE